jgi:hypothetical protein
MWLALAMAHYLQLSPFCQVNHSSVASIVALTIVGAAKLGANA